MSSCCSGESCDKTNVAWSTRTACPRCGAVGKVVGDETIRAILKPGHADALRALERRFCGTPSCAVLYYDAEGRAVEKSAASVRIGVKEAEDPIPLCAPCFWGSPARADVRREVAEQRARARSPTESTRRSLCGAAPANGRTRRVRAVSAT